MVSRRSSLIYAESRQIYVVSSHDVVFNCIAFGYVAKFARCRPGNRTSLIKA